MISLNRPLARMTNRRIPAGMGLSVLFALLISLFASGASIAQSSPSLEHGHSRDYAQIVVPKICLHQSGGHQTRNSGASNGHLELEQARAQPEHDCNTCCPVEGKAGSSSCLRSRDDHDWLAMLDRHDGLAAALLPSIASVFVPELHRSHRHVSQLTGLSEAQVQFLTTIRLLV